MSLLDLLFGKDPPPPLSQAVVITLRGTFTDADGELPDFASFQDRLMASLEESGTGEFDSNEVGQEEATIFLSGADAEKLYATVEPLLCSSPICHRASIIIRQGGPGSPQRIVQL